MTPMVWPDFNNMWDYNDPAATEARFRRLLPAAKAGDDRSYYLQLLTQIARSLSLQRNFAEANAILDEVKAAMSGSDLVELRYLLERGRTLNSSGQPEQAVPLFHKAVEVGKEIGADFYVVDALHMLGIAAPSEERLDWNLNAIAYTEQSLQERTRQWLGSLYNNTAWTLFDEGRYDEALALFEKAVLIRERQGTASEIQIGRWCMAKTLRVMGRPAEALMVQRELEAVGMGDGFNEEEIAECLLALGQSEAAKHYFIKAYEKLSQIDWVAEDQERMARLRKLSQ